MYSSRRFADSNVVRHMKYRILLIDDEPAIQFGFARYLTKVGYEVCGALSLREAREALLSTRFDAVLLDLGLPDGSGFEWISELREHHSDLPIIVITGIGDIPTAVESMRRGADNFLTKPVNMGELEVFLKKCLELGGLRRQRSASQRLSKTDHIYFGEHSSMKQVFELISIAAGSDTPILLQGETGTGKGVLAKWIHNNSSRRGDAFVEVNCSSLRGELLSSELFGHSKGAFTSAVEQREGLVGVADGGTLFLDEIADMDHGVQAQFLKVIEEKQYRRLGEVKVRRSDFRLICATNRDLGSEVRNDRFRKDLFFRVNIFPIMIPPLRERIEDLAGLVGHILNSFNSDRSISEEALALFRKCSWPGNIRELRNVLERAVLLAHGKTLLPDHFPGLDLTFQTKGDDDLQALDLDAIEEVYIKRAIKEANGDFVKASEILGISRATLYRKLKRLRERQ